MSKEKKQAKQPDAQASAEVVISPAVFKAMWPNQPVNVCAKHAQALTNIGAAIGLQVPLLPLLDDEECVNCKNESKSV